MAAEAEEEEEALPVASPNLVQAFFHLHCVHQSSLCSMPYTFLHFLASPRGRRTGDFGDAPPPPYEAGDADDGEEEEEEEEVEMVTPEEELGAEPEAGFGLSLMYLPPWCWK